MIRNNCTHRRLYGYSTLLVSLSISLLLGITPFTAAAQDHLSETEQIIHVLNRLAYGTRPGDIERVKTIGIPAYIEEQLFPETIPDPIAEEKLAEYEIVGMAFGELVAYDHPSSSSMSYRRRQNVQQRARLAEEMMAEETSSGGAQNLDREKAARRNLLNPDISGEIILKNQPESGLELIDVRLLRAIYSERQLLEMMVDFWANHFNVFFRDFYLSADYTQNAIRPNALGKFEDLLVATATHPAMMFYLDNWLSSAPVEVVKKRLARGHAVSPGNTERRSLAMRKRRQFFDQATGLNENYARELMELHTLGVDGGYTQEDVIQVAKSFTGWTVAGMSGGEPEGEFMFDPLLHEGGDKVVLGETISSGGMDEGMRILKMLAQHPSTARFISTKLVRRFVADDPPEEIIEVASHAFTRTGGDIREVLRAIFTSPDFFSPEYYFGKVKKPIELVASAMRAVSADIDGGSFATMSYLNRVTRRMGEPLYRHLAPDGFPDVASAWISTNTLYLRMEFAIDLSTGKIPDVRVDIDAAHSLIQQLDFPEQTSSQFAGVRSLAQQMGDVMMQSSEMMQVDMMQRPESSSQSQEIVDTRVLATVVALGSPRFQNR